MSDAAQIKRNLKIKTGAAKRLLKEHDGYKNEVTELQIKRDKLVADGAEEWDIKNGTKMMEESGRMVKDVATRLGNTLQELRDLIILARKNEEVADSEELVNADAVLEEASA